MGYQQDTFRALVAERDGDEISLRLRTWTVDQLPPGNVTIRVAYSSVNYKDALATRSDGRVAREYPLVPGIDLAGTIEGSTDPHLEPGQAVVVHGYDLGVAHHGGFAERARVPAGWVVPLPDALSLRQAMALGTAGFTAALSVDRLEHLGLQPDHGVVLVTGATGGVGSVAVDLLAARGYTVAASTGSPQSHAYLKGLGASEILTREETSAPGERPLESERWAGAVDTVGGQTLEYLLRTVAYGGSIAACGNVGGASVRASVFPFILRGASLLGIDSVRLRLEKRRAIWRRLATDLRPPHLDTSIAREIALEEVPETLRAIYQGQVQGRVVVRLDH